MRSMFDRESRARAARLALARDRELRESGKAESRPTPSAAPSGQNAGASEPEPTAAEDADFQAFLESGSGVSDSRVVDRIMSRGTVKVCMVPRDPKSDVSVVDGFVIRWGGGSIVGRRLMDVPEGDDGGTFAISGGYAVGGADPAVLPSFQHLRTTMSEDELVTGLTRVPELTGREDAGWHALLRHLVGIEEYAWIKESDVELATYSSEIAADSIMDTISLMSHLQLHSSETCKFCNKAVAMIMRGIQYNNEKRNEVIEGLSQAILDNFRKVFGEPMDVNN